jgi:(1->4)-alpha-D-glucan 1-alpha-D-glucosylmutase
MQRPLSAPVSIYRLQFNKDFSFADATRLLDYLCELGITDVYASPILMSRKGSEHGYDVTDPTRINPEIGSEQDFEVLQTELAKRGMGLVLDIVPNHMAASSENRWWMDVLENGPQSAFASYFDIDWDPPSRHLAGKVLLPILGRPFDEALEQGQLQLTFQDGKFFVRYFESILPVAPESYYRVLGIRSETLESVLGKETSEFQEFSGIVAGFVALAQRGPGASANESRPKLDAMRERLRLLASDHPAIASLIESSLKEFNGTAGNPASFVLLERLLSEEHYLLAYWLDPNEGINYRRFFAISDLVGVRVEDPIVFEATHDHILRILAKGASQGLRMGLRVDHIDGLRDPLGYLTRLQQRLAEAQGPSAPHPYVLVEKILNRTERLPDDWPISGTTGYEYLNDLNGLFVDREGCEQIETIYSQFVGRKMNFADVVYEKKKLVMNSLLRVEVRGLARQLAELAAKDRYARTIPRLELIDGLTEVTACMPVYRTYIRSLDVPPTARTTIEEALKAAHERRPQLSQLCVDFLRDVLTLSNPAHIGPEQREERLAFVMRWQQFTGPIVAKGFEDTALYVYYPLCSLNEVGGNPEASGIASREEFYEFVRERQHRWPHTLNATTTHDTKRSEDLRARVNVLSEIPEEWAAKIAEWAKENAIHKQMINGLGAPDANEEYLIYQTLLGMWSPNAADLPSITKRLQDYMVKALREAKVHTRWIEPNEVHERAVNRFIELILSPRTAPQFLADIAQFQRRLAWCGMINGLGQALLKIVTPGTPDFYQGSELWDLRLVDPDNRGPIDFTERCKALRALENAGPSPDIAFELLQRWPNGHIKIHIARIALRHRLEHPELFDEGSLVPVIARGVRSQNVISILRHTDRDTALAVVPRWLAPTYTEKETLPAADFWEGTALLLAEFVPDSWINLFTGERVESRVDGGDDRSLALADVLRNFPVALLIPASRV